MSKYKLILVLVLVPALIVCNTVTAQDSSLPATDESEVKSEIEQKAMAAKELRDKRETAEKTKRETEQKSETKSSLKQDIEIDQLNLLEDTTPRLVVREVRISGNSLIATELLLKNIPSVYNASFTPLPVADSSDLYDFRILGRYNSKSRTAS